MPRLFATTSAVRPNPMQFVESRISSGVRAVWPEGGECTAFPDSLRCSSPVRILSGTCRSSHRTLIFRLGQGLPNSRSFPNSSKTVRSRMGIVRPCLLIRFFRSLAGGRQKRIGYKGQKTAHAVRCSPSCVVAAGILLPSPRGRRTTEAKTATPEHGSRVILAFSPESFRSLYFAFSPKTRGALHAQTRAQSVDRFLKTYSNIFQ